MKLLKFSCELLIISVCMWNVQAALQYHETLMDAIKRIVKVNTEKHGEDVEHLKASLHQQEHQLASLNITITNLIRDVTTQATGTERVDSIFSHILEMMATVQELKDNNIISVKLTNKTNVDVTLLKDALEHVERDNQYLNTSVETLSEGYKELGNTVEELTHSMEAVAADSTELRGSLNSSVTDLQEAVVGLKQELNSQKEKHAAEIQDQRDLMTTIHATTEPVTEAPITITSEATTPATLKDFRIRLVDGPTANQGRLELLYNGIWGSLCDDYFETVDAKVTCIQLGYRGVRRFAGEEGRGGAGLIASWNIPEGTGRYWDPHPTCTGNERSFFECSMEKGWVAQGCNHPEDVALECY